MKIKDNYIFLLFTLLASVWAVVFFALPDFFDNPIEDFKSCLTIGAYIVVIFIAVYPLLVLMTVNRYVATIFILLFGVLGSIVAYYRIAYNATVTVIMIDAVVNTTFEEASGVLTPGLFAYIALNITIAIVLVIWRHRIPNPKYSLLWGVVGLLGIVIAYNVNERIKYSIIQRYPYNIFYYGKEYYSFMLKQSLPREQLPVTKIENAPDSLTVVFVLGESVRSDHLSINGYKKLTTPLLGANSNVVSMGDVWSPYTNTGSAVPYILTPANEKNKEWAQTKDSFIPYYKERGFYTVWLSNQDMGNGYSYFIQSTDTMQFVNSKHSVWTFDSWTDEEMIAPLKKYINMGKSKELFVVHTIGAHWYYNLHYPDSFKKFVPVTASRVVTNNKPDEVINSYDNCIAYMDYFVHSIIKMLSDRNAVVLYQSDHGEGLGENGAWLHASEGKMMHHPAGFVWYSDKYKENNPDVIKHIDELSRAKKGTDYVFPLMLRLIGLKLSE